MTLLRRSAIFASVSTAALALSAVSAWSQAFEGTPNPIVGSVAIDRMVPGVDRITVNTPRAVIDWTPTDNAGSGDINFLPSGTTAIFTSGDLSDYAVLNRIVPADPSRRIALNGNVIGQLQDGLGNVSPGGSVWFYSPGGILVGSTAVFDVGNLVLTAADPIRDGDGNFLSDGNFSLAATPGSTAGIEIAAGAQISAMAEGSYIAMVAPRITQAGNVTVNGTAAYVAAEAVDFSFDQGLFAINVTTGTESGGNVFTHSGTTTGPASTGFANKHRIYMVAVPKNDAITMVISAGGSIGFEPAVSAGIENGAVILSAGHNVLSNGSADNIDTLSVNDTEANLHITGGSFTARVDGRAKTDITATGSLTGSLSVDGDIVLNGSRIAHIGAQTGQTVTINGSASAVADGYAPIADGMDRTGGEARIYAEGTGLLTIAGNATAGASGFAYSGSQDLSPTAGDGRGGNAGILASGGGSITIGGDAGSFADGYAGFNLMTNDSGNGFGGTSRIAAASGGTITVSGTATARAFGEGSMRSGDGTGGIAAIHADGGTLQIGGLATVDATGRGGQGDSFVGGNGLGGIAEIGALNGGSVTLDNAAVIDSSGFGGAGSVGGTGTGMRSSLFARGGTVTVAGDTQILSDGTGGDVFSIASGVNGSTGAGGIAEAVAETGSIASTLDLGTLSASANGYGGRGSSAMGGDGGLGGAGIGGQVSVYADGAGNAVTAQSVSLNAVGEGGQGGQGGSGFVGQNGGNGGTGTGGTIRAGASGALTASADFGSLQINAIGQGGGGGSGGFGSNGTDGASGAGGLGTGGNAQLFAQSGSVAIGDSFIDVSGFGGVDFESMANSIGGDGTGGIATVSATAGGILTAEGLSAYADGRAGESDVTGIGTSGTVRIASGTGSNITLGSLTIGAEGDMAAGRFVELSALGGTLAITNDATLRTTGDIALAADGGSVDIGGFLDATADGAFLAGVNNVTPALPGEIRANAMTLQADGAIATRSTLVSAGRLVVDSGGAVTVGALRAGEDVIVAGVTGVSTGTVDATAHAAILSGGPVALGSLNANGTAYVADVGMLPLLESNYDILNILDLAPVAVNGAITVAGMVSGSRLNVATSQGFTVQGATIVDDFALDVAGALTLDGVSTAGNFIYTSNGDFTVGDIAAGGVVEIGAAGSIATGALSANEGVFLTASGGAITVGGPVVTDGQFSASTQSNFTAQGGITANSITVNAGGTAGFNGVANAFDIFVRSADIAIGTSGALGTSTTDALTLSNEGGITLGGTGGTGYVLDGAEAARLHANAITIDSGGSVLVRDMALTGSGAGANANLVGSNARLSISAPGEIRVTGALAIANAGTEDRLQIGAGQRFALTNEAGSITLSGSGTAPAGRLVIDAPDIAIASTALVDQLAADPFFQGRDAALARAGAPRPNGVIQAGSLDFGVSRSLMIQNTGSPGVLGGFTAGAGGIRIRSTLPSNGNAMPVDMNIFGRLLNADGSTVVNVDVLDAIVFETGYGAGFTTTSLVNGCALDGSICAPVLSNPITVSPAIQGIIEEAAEALTSEDATAIPEVRVATVIDTAAFSTETLIEEPVSGGGNSSLWDAHDGDDDADGAQP